MVQLIGNLYYMQKTKQQQLQNETKKTKTTVNKRTTRFESFGEIPNVL